MSIFTIDEEKCHRDGFCAAACPMGIIDWPDQQEPPRPSLDAAGLCILCGHCAAVCPHGALELEAMPLADMPEIKAELNLSPQQAEQFLRSRRSIRNYQERAVDRAILEKLIGVARHAPSGHNLQPVQWLVLGGRDRLKGLAEHVIGWMKWMLKEHPGPAQGMHMDRVIARFETGKDVIFRGAPQVVVAHAPKDDRTAPVACALALGYLELMAPTLGLGACWAGFFNAALGMYPPLIQAVDLPKGHAPFGSMMVGYAGERYFRLPARKQPPITWR